MSLPRGLTAARKNTVSDANVRPGARALVRPEVIFQAICIKSSTAQKAWKTVASSLYSVLRGFSSGSSHKTKNAKINTNWYLPWCLVRENEPLPAFLEAVTPCQGKKPVGMSHGPQDLPANGKAQIHPNSRCLRTTCFVQDVSPWVAKEWAHTDVPVCTRWALKPFAHFPLIKTFCSCVFFSVW